MASTVLERKIQVKAAALARDDQYVFDEDGETAVLLDVMDNDRGGSASLLWSVYQQDPTTTFDERTTQSGPLEWRTLVSGARIAITSDNLIAYDQADAAPAIQGLAEGESWTDTFTYTLRMANGVLSAATVSITFMGANDGPVIEALAGDSAGSHLTEGNEGLVAAGTLSVADADLSDTVAVAIRGVTVVNGAPGPLTEEQLLRFFSLGSSTLAADPGSTGNLSWSFSSGAEAFDFLQAGEELRLRYEIAATDTAGATAIGTVTIVIVGSNDAPVVTSEPQAATIVEFVDGTPGENATLLTTGGTITFADPDGAATAATSFVPAADGYRGSFQLGPVDQAGRSVAWTYTVDDAELDNLAAGQTVQQLYTVTIDDGQGGSVVETVTISLTGTNDAPSIVGGTTAGIVKEDGPVTVSGALNAVDPDAGAALGWSVVGGSPAQTANYTFSLDNFRISKNGATFFEDGFNDGLAPPQSPDFPGGLPTSYGIAGGMTEANGRVILSSDLAIPVQGVGTTDPFIGQLARVRSDINPNDLQRGLKIDDDFVVEGRFDLVLPDATREYYGIRLSDRLIGGTGTPPDQPGDDVIELIVRQGADGVNRIQFRELDFAADSVTNIMGVPLTPPPGADQIALRLSHAANTGTVTASFDYLDGGTVVATLTLLQTARIFGTETPGYTGDDETWTRAEFIAASPQVVGSSLEGMYGTLFVEQNGAWTYTLANGSAAVQQLAEGETAVDSFTIAVADEHGAIDTRTVSVTVRGTNDAPIVLAPNTQRSLHEDAAPTLSATGLGAFSDVDLADTHSVGASLHSAVLSSGSAMPPALAGFLAGALTASITQAANGSGAGSYRWDFALPSSAAQGLAAGETLSATYRIAVRDDHGGEAAQFVTIDITGSNDAPTITSGEGATPATALQVAENTVGPFLTVMAADPENQDITFSIGANPDGSFDNGFFTVDPVSGALSFASPPDFEFVDPGNDDLYKVRVTATDSQGASTFRDFFVQVTDVNEAPVAVADTAAGYSTNEDTAVFLNVLSNDVDPDGDTLSIAGLGDGATNSLVTNRGATVTVVGDRLLYDPTGSAQLQALAAGESLVDSFLYTVADPGGLDSSAMASIVVQGENDAPTITSGEGATPATALQVAENTVGPFLTVMAADPENQDITFSIGANPDGSFDNGFFTVDPVSGALSFASPPDFEFVDPGNDDLYKVRVTATDSQGASAFRDFFVQVTDVNEAPAQVNVVGTQLIDFNGISGPLGIHAGFEWSASDSFYWWNPDWYGDGFGAVYNGYAGKYSFMSRSDGADFSVDRLDIWQHQGAFVVDFVGIDDGVEVYRQSHALNASRTTVELDFSSIDALQVVVMDGAFGGSGVSSTGWWYIDNILVA